MIVKHREAGTTLIELLVVLAIIAIASAIAYPTLTRGREQTLDQLASRLASQLRAVRSSAIAMAAEQSLLIETESRVVATASGQRLMDLPDTVSLDIVYGRDRSSSGQPEFKFFPQGNSTGGSITLRQNGRERVVSVNWVTGAIMVQ
jgi:general secretion pathway protein H